MKPIRIILASEAQKQRLIHTSESVMQCATANIKDQAALVDLDDVTRYYHAALLQTTGRRSHGALVALINKSLEQIKPFAPLLFNL